MCTNGRIVRRLRAWVVGAVMLAGLAYVPPVLAQFAEIEGTGGSAATRVLMQWSFLSAKQNNIAVKYATAVSDVGIREMIARSVDFGSTEIPLSTADLKSNDLIQFPLLIGGVAAIVNIPGVEPGKMRLNADVLSKIYLGRIKSWDDQEIRALNPDLSLPKLPIRPIVREEPASTTLAFTTHLANNSVAWKTAVGASKLPSWPIPVERVVSTQGMGEKVRVTTGAVGYVNFDEAFRNHLTYTQLQNRAGVYVTPAPQSFQSTTQNGGLARAGDQLPLLVDVEGVHSWPIVYVTYVLVDRRPKNLERARATLKFFFWAFMQGDSMAAESGFVPLPATQQARVVGRFRDILGPDNSPLDFLR